MSGLSTDANSFGFISDASAATPIPDAALPNKCRRVICAAVNCWSGSISYSLVIVSSRLRIMLATVVQAASSGLSNLA